MASAQQRGEARSPESANAAIEAEFERHRPLLFGIAYRMLGSAADAEDVLQEAFLRVRDAGDVRSPRAYLTTVVTRLCIDQRKSAHTIRESYIGPWLPEPVLTDAHDPRALPAEYVGQRESISMAFLVLLERLTPVERAVFLLREVFDFDYAEIAGFVERSEAACRQSFHRARAHLAEERSRFAPSATECRRLTESFLHACEEGDVAALTQVLAEDAVQWSDGGGKRAAALRPIRGRDALIRLLAGLERMYGGSYRLTYAEVNGGAGFLFFLDGVLWTVTALDFADGQIQTLYSVVNPEKLDWLIARSEASLDA